LSRLGRDYIQTGYYTEIFFNERNVRYIAINDGVDTLKADNDIAPFRNILNDMYSKDISRKVKSAKRQRALKGLFIGNNAPYGYRKSPENPQRWIIDEIPAEVVRKIFRLCMEGMGVTRIANLLRDEQIETPIVYAVNAGFRKGGRGYDSNPYDWNNNTVGKILERREYLGHTINFKTHRKSYKSKKTFKNDPSEYVVFENTHPAIIEEEVFEQVQQIRNSGKRRRNSSGRVSLLSGIVHCADCKSKLYLSSGACLKPEQDSYTCSGFQSKKKQCFSAHFIRRVVLEQSVLIYLQQVTAFATQHEKAFVERLESQNADKLRKDLTADRKALTQAEKRIQELDNIIQRLYEDNVSGKLTDERFIKLSQGYEREQKELETKVTTLQSQITEQQENTASVDMFLRKVRKYTDITELTTVMMNELVKRVEVHAPDRSSGKKVQRIEIVFNYVGNIGEIGLPNTPNPAKIQISAENG